MMGENPMRGVKLAVLACFCVLLIDSSATPNSTFTLSSFSYPETKLKPFEWRYLRVDLPPWFSSMIMTLVTNANIDMGTLKKQSKSTLPIICLRAGSFPLRDVSEIAVKTLELNVLVNGSNRGMQDRKVADWCFPLPKNITVALTNEQISPGVWYIGFFNGIGPVRTQSKMISQGTAYTFSADISIEECITSTTWGPFCNESINFLSCSESDMHIHPRGLQNLEIHDGDGDSDYLSGLTGQVTSFSMKKESTPNPGMPMIAENVLSCRNLDDENACLLNDEIKLFTLEVLDMALELKIMATDVRLNQTSTPNASSNVNDLLIMCYARHNAMPLSSLHDYSGEISKGPLVIPSPKVGRWYIVIHVENQTNVNRTLQEKNMQGAICLSLKWEVHQCPLGKAGPNCTWESHMLQRVLRRSPSLPFESYYLPSGGKLSMKSTNFPLEPLLSNSSFEDKANVVWTYFILDVPRGAAGANIHLQLISDSKVNYEMYARYGGLPSLQIWDYYVNSLSSSNGSMFLSFHDSSDSKMDFYILYAKEGIWSFGLMNREITSSKDRSTMYIALEGCPKRCSNHGTCRSAMDGNGYSFYRFWFRDTSIPFFLGWPRHEPVAVFSSTLMPYWKSCFITLFFLVIRPIFRAASHLHLYSFLQLRITFNFNSFLKYEEQIDNFASVGTQLKVTSKYGD